MAVALNEQAARDHSTPMTREERKVIIASSAGTIFEWYDFYLYGALATTVIGPQFFSAYPDTTQAIFALLAFAAGFIVRPFGALVFGRLGDLIGRKYTFLVTILIMGLSTFLVGLLPSYASIGTAAPVALILLRMAQGLGAAITGTSRIRDSTIIHNAGRPIRAKTRIAMMSTAKRKLVPQRTCSLSYCRTAATSSGTPASKALTTLCSAPW